MIEGFKKSYIKSIINTKSWSWDDETAVLVFALKD
jgi:hypothetical protein